jgi:hypothetical protein
MLVMNIADWFQGKFLYLISPPLNSSKKRIEIFFKIMFLNLELWQRKFCTFKFRRLTRLYEVVKMCFHVLTLNLLTTTVVAHPSNASKWQMGFNAAFKGLKAY